MVRKVRLGEHGNGATGRLNVQKRGRLDPVVAAAGRDSFFLVCILEVWAGKVFTWIIETCGEKGQVQPHQSRLQHQRREALW